MKKIILFLIVAFMFAGCCPEEQSNGRHRTKLDANFWVRVCSIGDTDASSCVDMYAYKVDYRDPFFKIKKTDGEMLRYNIDGWSIIYKDLK